jgi:hypothetical protein
MTLLGDVGVPPVVEVSPGVAPRCGMPFFGSRGIGVHEDAPEDDVVQEVCAGRCPVSARVGWQEAETLTVGQGLGCLV